MSMLLVSRVSAGASGERESGLSSLWHRLHQALTERVPVTQRDGPLGDLAYDVDAAFMLLQRPLEPKDVKAHPRLMIRGRDRITSHGSMLRAREDHRQGPGHALP
jgi:hypothetical protein